MQPGGRALRFEISSDSAVVVYSADQETDRVTELYSVPIGGGTPVKLNGPVLGSGVVGASFGVSPDSSRVVYTASQDDPKAQINVFERVARSRSVQLQEAQHQVDALSAQLDVVTSSKSWRLTAPLRRITGDDG